jgi:hypothetical protein
LYVVDRSSVVGGVIDTKSTPFEALERAFPRRMLTPGGG